jgi:hypothetical protein
VHRFLCKFVKQRVLSYRPEPESEAFLVRCPAIVHTRHRDFVLNLRVRNTSPRTFLLVLPVDPVVAPCDVLAVLAGRPLSGAFSCGQRGTVTTVSKPLRRQPLDFEFSLERISQTRTWSDAVRKIDLSGLYFFGAMTSGRNRPNRGFSSPTGR